jgi:hypothetical protein
MATAFPDGTNDNVVSGIVLELRGRRGKAAGMAKKALTAAILFLAVVGIVRADDGALTVNDKMPGLAPQRDFPQTKLRGYGALSGKAWTDAGGGSLLQINCQDAEHARLVQAKYLSDLAELPPATQSAQIDVSGTKISIQTAESVGAVAALRNGTTVVLAAAKDADALAKLIAGGVKGDAAKWTSVAEGKVPMFLDRFDKYGFRFYYAPGNLPSNADGQEDITYDPREDFKWMQAMHAGLTVWTNGQEGETDEWLPHDSNWNWTLPLAQQKGLPFGMNLGIDGAVNWYFNRNPESMMQYAPGFLGTYYGSMNFGIAQMVSWSSAAGQDAMLGQIQTTVRNLNGIDNVTSWLEPHEELGGGVADLLVDYGPLADTSFRNYLLGKYKSIQAVAKRYQDESLTAWSKVHVPEPAAFLGWSGDAIDLAGPWKVSLTDADNTAAQAPDFNDSSWGQIMAPGNGMARRLPMKPALWRRHFTMDSGFLSKHPAVWLYVWDMNDARGSDTDASRAVVVSMNGKVQAEDKPYHGGDHWGAYDVTKAIQADNNVLAVRLPQGLFNYRVYISGDAPKSYPQLGEGKNALWVDYSEWLGASRGKGVQRGMQMIRQIDPNRGIVLMAPDSYENEVIQDAIQYGGDFHNTGYMGGWWCDKEPALMRGAGLPFSTEPSQGPTLPQHIMGEMGNWFTEAVNAIDHFQTIGEVLYHPDLKKTFEDHAAMYTSVGRFHAPVAQIAALYSSHTNDLLGWPWAAHPAAADNGQPYFRGGSYPSGFNDRGFYSPMENMPKGTAYESDAVNDGMLERNQANKYRVIVDTDTAIMDKATIDGIERFVRGGGVFVTYGETGRHSPETPDSWPINRLTGYVLANDRVNGPATVALDANQKVFPPGTAFSGNMDGHQFKAVAKDAQAILSWDNGTTAVGMRPIGKGYIITVGAWFNGENGNAFMSGIFQWLKIDPIPAHMETSGNILWRHFLSNNGLYDVWVIWNKDGKAATQGTLVLDSSLRPAWSIDLKTGTRNTVTDGKLPVDLPPVEMAMLITPRAGITGAPSEWFTLQRGWWQGTASPGTPLPKPDMKLAMDITDGWAFQALEEKTDVTPMVDPKFDDKAWKKVSLGVFTMPDYPDCRHAIVRKQIHVPNAWNHGRVMVHLPSFRDGGGVFLDGKPMDRNVSLAGGSDHVLVVEMRAHRYLMGADGPAWVNYHPAPAATQKLNASFEPSTDFLNWKTPIPIPGEIPQDTKALRADFIVAPEAAGKTVVLHGMENSGELHGVVVNGQYVSPYVREGSELNLNITPWIVPAKKNEIILMMGGSHETITELTLEFHNKGTYP